MPPLFADSALECPYTVTARLCVHTHEFVCVFGAFGDVMYPSVGGWGSLITAVSSNNSCELSHPV